MTNAKDNSTKNEPRGAARDRRRAEALRANLARRKAQARERAEGDSGNSGGEDGKAV